MAMAAHAVAPRLGREMQQASPISPNSEKSNRGRPVAPFLSSLWVVPTLLVAEMPQVCVVADGSGGACV